MNPGRVPLSLYIHLPWCVAKCPYCDFNSHALSAPIPQTRYVDALLEDLEIERQHLDNPRVIESIFFGGGTPSLFSAREIARFLDRLAQCFDLAGDVEITLEANPGTVEHDSFTRYRQAGVNRISLGVQSFDDSLLKTIGRIHDAQAAQLAVESINAAGFERFNIDLMFALPGQTPEQAAADIAQAVEFDVAHLSWYQLTLEPGTPFHKKPPPLPDREQAWIMQDTGHSQLSTVSLDQYEVSAFAKPGHQCRHNLNYWQFGDYIGIGAGAHGKLTQANGDIHRRVKIRHPSRYMNADPAQRLETQRRVTTSEQLFEFMLNQLRLKNGFPKAQFLERTQISLTTLEAKLAPAMDRGFLRPTRDGWAPTKLGFRFLNDLQAAFLPD